jgi:hypothetical protein
LLSGVLVTALELAIGAGLAGCATSSSTTQLDRHFVHDGISHIACEDFDVVSFLDVDLHTAVQTREAVESEFSAAYGRVGHPRWFFHSFDGKHLDFVVARFAPTDPGRPRYVAERRLRVKRSPGAERALGVAAVVHDYEDSPHEPRRR